MQMTGEFTGNSRASFPYSLAAKEDQTIFSPDCVPEGFTLSDPDHLSGVKIVALYSHWLIRQREGLSAFIVLKASPNHGVSGSKKKSEDQKGKGKIKYVDVSTDEEGSEGRNSNGDEELRPAVKIGPPKPKAKKIPTPNADSVQVPADSMLFAPVPGPSTLPPPKQSPKKKIGNKKQPDEILGPTERPATRSSSKPTLTKKILTTNEASKIAKTAQAKRSSRRHGEKDLVDKVSKLSEA
jgi:hypothetical protein